MCNKSRKRNELMIILIFKWSYDFGEFLYIHEMIFMYVSEYYRVKNKRSLLKLNLAFVYCPLIVKYF